MSNGLDKLTKTEPTDVIPSGSLNLTLASGLVAAIATILNAFPGMITKIFGGTTPSDAVRAAIFLGIFAAFAVIAAADILARGYASGRKSGPIITAVPHGLKVSRPALVAADENNWTVSAVEVTPSATGGPASMRYFVTKAGKDPAWLEEKDIKF